MLITLIFIVAIAPQLVRGYSCPPGLDCVGNQTYVPNTAPIACALGFFCPDGYNITLCARGSYCPQPSQEVSCESAHWCPSGSSFMFDCRALSSCPAGSYKARWFLLLVLGACIWLALWVAYSFNNKKRLRRIQLRYQPRVTPIEMESVKAGLQVAQQSAIEVPVSERSSRLVSITLSVDHLTYEIPGASGDPKTILHDISGKFRSGRFAAIMGPSGSGKTTLLNCLSGKILTKDAVTVNGIRDLSRLRQVVGVVPQEDVMLRMLTVQDVLVHSALSRLPVDWSYREKMELVEEVIDVLGLDHVRYSVIGDETKRGISGGERKRVNIGIELVADPIILFLDEPTSGLDATAAEEVAQAIVRISRRGTMVIAVLHQPRYEIFKLLDDLWLLAAGGFQVYSGPALDSLVYFNSMGYVKGRIGNPADFLIDIVSGQKALGDKSDAMQPPSLTLATPESSRSKLDSLQAQDYTDPDPAVVKANVDFLKVQWIHWRTQLQQNLSKGEVVPVGAEEVHSTRQLSYIFKRVTPRFHIQCLLHLYRFLLMDFRDLSVVAFDSLFQVIPGIALGWNGLSDELLLPPLQYEVALLCPEIIRDRCLNQAIFDQPQIGITFFITMIIGVAASVFSVRSFGKYKAVFLREVSSGMSVSAYWFSRNVYDLIHVLRCAFIFLAAFLLISSPRGAFDNWVGLIFSMYLAGFGLGYMVSCVVRFDRATIVSVVMAVAISVTSGLNPSLDVVKQWGPMVALWYISYNFWGAQALVILTTFGQPNVRLDNFIQNAGYDPTAFSLSVGMIVVIAVVQRLLTLLFLYRMRSTKRLAMA